MSLLTSPVARLLSHEYQVCWSSPSRCLQNPSFFLSVSEFSPRPNPHPSLPRVMIFNYVHWFFDNLPLQKVNANPPSLECGPDSATHFYWTECGGIDPMWLSQGDEKVSFCLPPSQVIRFGGRQPPHYKDTRVAWRGHVPKSIFW